MTRRRDALRACMTFVRDGMTVETDVGRRVPRAGEAGTSSPSSSHRRCSSSAAGRAASRRPPPPPRRAPTSCSSTSARSWGGSTTSSRRDACRRRRAGARPAVPGRPRAGRPGRAGRRDGAQGRPGVGRDERPRAVRGRRRAFLHLEPAPPRARDGRVRARRAASRLDAAGLHDDRSGADADARVQVLPGQRVLVSGNGPLNVQVAAEVVRAGATVVALCESARAASPARAPAAAAMAARAPDLMRDGLGYLRTLRAARVPVLYGHSVVRAEGDGRVERAVVARLDARRLRGARK